MISKLAKMKNSWFVKGVLILTALSFMSLFGVAGYVGSRKNKPAIKVDDVVVYQDEIAYQFQREQQMARNIFGDNIEITDEIRNAMLQGIVQRELNNAITTRVSQKYDIHVSNNLVKQIIYSQAEFRDEMGRFDINKLRQLLSMSGWSEDTYVNTIKKDIIKQQIVHEPISNFNVPKIMLENLAKIENARRIFKYVKIDPKTIKVDRSISQEELDQYYTDFAQNFVAPETRDVSVVLLTMGDIEKKIEPSAQEIDEYYQANLDQFVVPETRDVAQMVFETEEDAQKAYDEVISGTDFMKVASDVAKQSHDETNLGYVSEDLMIPEVGEKVFAAKKGGVIAPTQSDMGWHIMMVKDIKSGSKTPIDTAKAKIVAQLKKDKAYDEAYAVSREIDDKVGGGASLEDVAKEMGANVMKIKMLSEDGNAAEAGNAPKDLLVNHDFIETAFSYNVDEISQVVEVDNGFILVRVDKINEAHVRDLAEVAGDIKKLWLENEKSAIAQEKVNDLMHDLEEGDELLTVASRYGFGVTSTGAIKRSDTFAGLPQQTIVELFQEDIGTPKVIENNAQIIIAVPSEDIESKKVFSQDELDMIRARARVDLSREFAKVMIDSYAQDFDVRVKYRLIGLNEGL